VVLRCTLKLRDGRVHVGFTPAFDPADGSVWLTATPDSPAGTMFTIERLRALVLEPNAGRAISLPEHGDHTTMPIRLDYPDGEQLYGERKVDLPGVGLWIEPPGLPGARAFVPKSAATVEIDADAMGAEGWSFLERPQTDNTPTDAQALPTLIPPPPPSESGSNTQPSIAPSLIPPAMVDKTEAWKWPDDQSKTAEEGDWSSDSDLTQT